MLRWVMGIKRIEKLRADEIRAKAGVTSTRKFKMHDMVRKCREKDRGSENTEASVHRKGPFKCYM